MSAIDAIISEIETSKSMRQDTKLRLLHRYFELKGSVVRLMPNPGEAPWEIQESLEQAVGKMPAIEFREDPLLADLEKAAIKIGSAKMTTLAKAHLLRDYFKTTAACLNAKMSKWYKHIDKWSAALDGKG